MKINKKDYRTNIEHAACTHIEVVLFQYTSTTLAASTLQQRSTPEKATSIM